MLKEGDWIRARKFNPAGWPDDTDIVRVIKIDRNGFVHTDAVPNMPYIASIFELVIGGEAVYKFVQNGTDRHGHVTFWETQSGDSYVSYAIEKKVDEKCTLESFRLEVPRKVLEDMVQDGLLLREKQWFGITYQTLYTLIPNKVLRRDKDGKPIRTWYDIHPKNQCRYHKKVSDDGPRWVNCVLKRGHEGYHRDHKEQGEHLKKNPRPIPKVKIVTIQEAYKPDLLPVIEGFANPPVTKEQKK